MTTRWMRIGIAVFLTVGLALAAVACGGDDPTPAPADTTVAPTPTPEPTEYYEGRTIRVVIPYTPGGSSSVLVPYFAHELPNFIPGNPRVVSSHITPIIAGYNYLAEADTDGTQIMYTSSAPFSQQYAEGSEFETGAFEYLLGYTSGESIMMVNGDVPINDLRTAKETGHTLRLPITTDPSELTGTYIAAMLSAEAFGFDLQLIPLSGASTGTAELLVAMERGDIDGQVAGAIWYTMPSLRPGWTEDGTIKPVAFFGPPGQTMRPNTETDITAHNMTDVILDGPYDDQIKNLWKAFVLPQVALGKHFLAPPDVDPEALAVLRQAFSDAMEVPTFVKGLERLLGTYSVNLPGPDLQMIIEDAATAFAEERDSFDTTILGLYNKYTGQ